MDGFLFEFYVQDELFQIETRLLSRGKQCYNITVQDINGKRDGVDMEQGQFLSLKEMFLFNEGTYYHCYQKFGSHRVRINGIWGVHFAIWAPRALRVCVIGNFNGWQGSVHTMEKQGETGVWTLFVPYLTTGEIYKYEIFTADGTTLLKSDPWAFHCEVRPHTASVVYDLAGYLWGDKDWMEKINGEFIREQPINIYEVHLGSWRRHQNGSFLNYRELAHQLVPYVKEMGYTHIELLPLMEHPLDCSWGYQVTGYYAATSRYGTPHDLKYFIDCCHQAGLGVIMDWVPGHFCKDAHGLGCFDGENLFEGEEHDQWGTYKFDFSRTEVWSFLIGNAVFWFQEYHVDGLRVDGVTSMLLLNFGKGEHNWTPNIYGGRENLEAVDFLRKLNQVIFHYFPGALMIAEESTDWPMVTKPSHEGGLGFNFKWNMGWMNDTLKYMETYFDRRCDYHQLLTFSLLYAFSEEFILPFSHDEVVHGKRSLLNKMPGDYWRKFAGLRLLLCYQICHPGKKLLFMGGEYGQFIEWREGESLEWFLTDYEMHHKLHYFVKELNHLYLQETSLWELDYSWEGFRWLDVHNYQQSVLVFMRRDQKGNFLLVALNFRPDYYPVYRLGVPVLGLYQELFNTDAASFGGSDQINPEPVCGEEIPYHGQPYSIEVKLPPLGGIIIKLIPEFAD
ncbi:MAG: 1,4-alpha-glucan branching protein GlgB [Dehalobacterium sp.]